MRNSCVLLLTLLLVVQLARPREHHRGSPPRLTRAAPTPSKTLFSAGKLDPLDPEEVETNGNGRCSTCTLQERLYCESPAVYTDHCCCALRASLSMTSHDCWAASLPQSPDCRPIVDSCTEHTRILECCCRRQHAHNGQQNNVNPWVPFMVGELLKAWLEQRRGQLPIQNDGSGGNSRGSSTQVRAGGLCLVLTVVTSVVLLLA